MQLSNLENYIQFQLRNVPFVYNRNQRHCFSYILTFFFDVSALVPHSALLKLLDIVVPCFLETVRREPERHVVMGVLESMNSVIKSCKEEVFKNPSRLKEISHAIRDVLKKKVRVWVMDGFIC